MKLFSMFKKNRSKIQENKIKVLEKTIIELKAEIDSLKDTVSNEDKQAIKVGENSREVKKEISISQRNTSELKIVDNEVISYFGTNSDVYIPEGVTKIRRHVFEDSSIKRIFLPESMKIIEASSFRNCKNLEYINIPLGLQRIGEQSFARCTRLQTAGIDKKCNIVLDPMMKKVPERLFFNCENLKSIILPPEIETIEKEAFWGCENLEELVVPNTCKMIGSNAFYSCSKLKNLKIKSETILFDGNIFSGCNGLANKEGFVIMDDILYWYAGVEAVVSIPYGVKEIARGAFEGSYLNKRNKNIIEIVIPNSVTTIRDKAFEECINLKKITIPESVQNIGDNLFYKCDRLEEIVVAKNGLKELKCLAEGIARNALLRKEREEQKRKVENAKTNIRNEQDLKNAVKLFVDRYNGDSEAVRKIVKYINAKLGYSIYKKGDWYFFGEKIEYKYEWGAHSFFDDGGGEEYLTYWTMNIIYVPCKYSEDDKLTDFTTYPKYTGIDESFICKNPFGLDGVFEFSYRSYYEKT